MKISPGARLVWEMAAHESTLAKVEQIEPEQIFCALLKFAEVDDEILGAAADEDDASAAALISDQDQVKASFALRALPTTRARRTLRHLCLGSHKRRGGVVHRSPETKALFQRAAGEAEGDILEAAHLLRVCLEAPTTYIRQAVEEVGGRLEAPEAEPEPTPKPQAKDSLLARYGRELAPLVKAGRLSVPEINTPQVQVLAEALGAGNPEPVLLVCEPGVPVVAIAGGVAKLLEDSVQVMDLKLGALVREVRDADARGDLLRSLLGEAVAQEGRAFFLDGTGLEDTSLRPALGILRTKASAGSIRLALALGVEAYQVLVRPDPDQASAWRLIWLHDLDSRDLPDAL